MEKIFLVTGAAGHVASVTIRKLKEQNHLIRGLILPSETGIDDNLITYFKGDVTKPETLEDFFSGLEAYEVTVIHLAAIVSIAKKGTPLIYNVNVHGTENVVSMCLKHKVKRLLYVSSVHALPEPEAGGIVKEQSFFSKESVIGAYAETKAMASQLVLDAAKKGLDVVIVHPSGILGPGDTGNNHISQMMKMYLNHRLPCGIKGGYDFVDVRDVANGILAAIEKGRSGECYLLTNKYVSVKELLEIMRSVTNRKYRTPCCPLWLAGVVAVFSELFAKLTKRRPLFTGYSIYTLGMNFSFCHDKATAELGFRPRPIEETVADTLTYLMQHQAGKTQES